MGKRIELQTNHVPMTLMIGAGVTATEGPAPSPSSTVSNVSAEAPVPAARAPESSVKEAPVPAPEQTSLEHAQGTVIPSTTASSILGCRECQSLVIVGAGTHQAQALASTRAKQVHCC